MKKEKTIKKSNLIVILLIIISLLLLNIMFSRISGSFEVSCNTGEIGLNYSGQWKNYSTQYYNGTEF